MTTPRLRGRRVVLTRPKGRADHLAAALRDEGAVVVEVPLLELRLPAAGLGPLAQALNETPSDGWVALTSASGLPGLLEAAGGVEKLKARRIAVVGDATASTLRENGLTPALVGDGTGGAGLARAFGAPSQPGEVVVLALAAAPRPELREGLHHAGWSVREAASYEAVAARVDDQGIESLRSGDLVVVTSSRGAELLFSMAPTAHLVAIGATTARTARDLGFPSVMEAKTPNPAGIVEAAVSSFENRPTTA